MFAIIKSPQLSVRGCHCLNRTVNIWAKCAFSLVCLCFALLRGTWSSKRFLPVQCNVRLWYRPAESRSAGLPNEQNPFHAVCKTNTLSQSVHCATTFLHASAPRISHVSGALFQPYNDNRTPKCNSNCACFTCLLNVKTKRHVTSSSIQHCFRGSLLRLYSNAAIMTHLRHTFRNSTRTKGVDFELWAALRANVKNWVRVLMICDCSTPELHIGDLEEAHVCVKCLSLLWYTSVWIPQSHRGA